MSPVSGQAEARSLPTRGLCDTRWVRISSHRSQARTSFATLLYLAACGGSTTLQGSDPTLETSDAEGDAAGSGRTVVDASTALPDATEADANGAPTPCHLVEDGEPAIGVAFSDPAFAFTQSGLLLRGGDGARIVQYGEVWGMRTGTWQDPPIFAAEYDVSVWPPQVRKAPTQLFHSSHEPVALTELPDGTLALAWRHDNDGSFDPNGIHFRTFDGSSWELTSERQLVQNGMSFLRPILSTDPAHWVTAYSVLLPSYEMDTKLGFFAFDGSEQRAIRLWTVGQTTDFVPLVSIARTASELLVAVTFGSCDGIVGLCEPMSQLVFRVRGDRLEKVASIPNADPNHVVRSLTLIADQADHTWLTWLESDLLVPDGGQSLKSIYALPLTADGAPRGPLERWYADTTLLYAPRRPASIGALGTTVAVSRSSSQDDDTQEVRLLHRQLDSDEPLEELTFTAPNVGELEVVQVGSPRGLVVGYSTTLTPGTNRHGELRRYLCREDLGSP